MVKVVDGILTAEVLNLFIVDVEVRNDSPDDVEVYLRVAKREGYSLSEPSESQVIDQGQVWYSPCRIPANSKSNCLVKQSLPIQRQVHVWDAETGQMIALYLEQADLDPHLKEQLKEIKKESADLLNRAGESGVKRSVIGRDDEV